MSGRAVEASGDVDVLLLDKTGTITLGNRQATEFIPAPLVTIDRLADAAQLASLADETPEGRSIAVLAKEKFNLRGREMAAQNAQFIPFTAQTRMSGVDFFDGGAPATSGGTGSDPARGTPTRDGARTPIRSIRKGAAEAMRILIDREGGISADGY